MRVSELGDFIMEKKVYKIGVIIKILQKLYHEFQVSCIFATSCCKIHPHSAISF
jgi:hypothetical protein